MQSLARALVAIALLIFVGAGLALGWPTEALVAAAFAFAVILFELL